MEGHIRLHLGIKEPERNIDALDFLDVVFILEGLWKQRLILIVFFQSCNGFFPADLEGDDEIRLLGTRQLPRNDGWIAAIGAGRCGSGAVADQLGTTGGAIVGTQVVGILSPLPASLLHVPLGLTNGFLLPGCFRSPGILFFIHPLDVFHRKLAAAVVALQHSGLTAEMQRCRAGRALVVGRFVRHDACSFPTG